MNHNKRNTLPLRRYINLLIILLLLSLFKKTGKAQQYLFNAEHLTIEDGLPTLSTYGIYQDQQGFIWIGSKFG
ncbi:MAG: two-component regulator propeller domain-containing protein, partial [Pseudomonadota bacterium]